MDTAQKYSRDKLVDLLAERAAFENAAVGLYDALMRGLGEVDEPVIAESMDEIRRHREDEHAHAEWVSRLLAKLGGKPHDELPEAVSLETRALESVITRETGRGALLPAFHAMLAAELMDGEGWKLLLQIADDVGDAEAVRELRGIVEKEDEHLALVRHVMLTLATESVRYSGGESVTGDGDGNPARTPRPRKPSPQRKEDILDVNVSGPAKATTDHEKIRRWVEERGGTPCHVKRTGGARDVGILRIDFPGFSGAKSLEAIDWDTWLNAFDANNLAFIYEEKTARGEPSRFNKLVSRDTIRRRLAGEHDASVHKGRRASSPRGRAGASPRTARKQGPTSARARA